MRKSKWCIWVCLLACAGILAGCGAVREPDGVGEEPRLVVYCALTSPFIESMINEFEKQTGVRVDLLPGDVVAYRSALETADVFFGIPVPMADAHLDDFRGYRSINEYHIRPDFRQPAGRITCFARSLNVILVNTNLLGERRLNGYRDLLAPELNGQVVFADPVHSAAGYRHFVNMLADMGGDTPAGWDFVSRFCRQATLAASAAEAAEAVAKGRYTAALTSENAALTQVLAGAPVQVVYMQEGVQSYLYGVSIAARTQNRLDAEKFVDFVTSKGTQFVLMRQLYYRPVRDDVLTIRPLLPAAELPAAVEMADFSWQQREDYLAQFVAGMKADGIKP